MSLILTEEVSLRAISEATTKSIVKHVSGLVRFYLEVRDETTVERTGGESVVSIRDYAGSIAERAERYIPRRITRYLYEQTL